MKRADPALLSSEVTPLEELCGARHAPMRILEKSIYRGPHLYSATPMIRLQADLGALEDWPTDRLPDFAGQLLSALPGLAEHGCSFKAPGGFLKRLDAGTWLGHVAEHVALELQTLAGTPVTRGKTRSVKGRPGVYNVLFEYQQEEVGLSAGYAAFRLVESLLPPSLRGLQGVERAGEPFDLAETLAELAGLARRSRLGPTTAALVAAAEQRGIPVARLNDQSLLRLGWGSRQKIIRASITGDTSQIAVETAGDKSLAKSLLAAAGIPVPKGSVVFTAKEAVTEAARLRGPVVTKPLDANHGRGVSLDLSTPEAVRWGFDQARRHSRKVIVEQQFQGRDYRVLVIGGKVVAVAERRPAQVVGDGSRPVEALIAEVNADPRRGVGHETVMTRITVDEHVKERLARAGLNLQSVPEAGRVVQLRTTANLSTGGVAIDRTDVIHPANAMIAERAAAVVGLDIAGIDFLTPDIAVSALENGGGIVEINAAPGFRMHLEPAQGEKRDVASPVVDMLFPERRNGRIPVVAVTGTNGKSTTVRMVAQILARRSLTVGFTSTSGVYVAGERIYKGDASGPISGRMVLGDPTVDAAVLETARGGILREGLAFDRCDVGCVLNVTDDHLGLKGVDTLEDLAAVKSVVTESVSRRGVSVLNGDDPQTLRIARHAGGRIAYFSLRGGPDLPAHLQKHVAEGGLAAVLEPTIRGGELVILDGPDRRPVISVDAVPAALGGRARFNVANALAAALIATGLGVPVDSIAAGLANFQSSFEDNPGRLNIHDGHGFRVIVDYAHNPAGIAALGEVIAALRPTHERVIGCVSIPGDRRDEDILAMGAAAHELFDHIVFRERPDGRGRKPGEVLSLLRRGALQAGRSPKQLECVPGEREAIDACLRHARPGDLVVLLPTDIEAAWAQVIAFRPEPRSTAQARAPAARA
jgi:cyanophycin synthetase